MLTHYTVDGEPSSLDGWPILLLIYLFTPIIVFTANGAFDSIRINQIPKVVK